MSLNIKYGNNIENSLEIIPVGEVDIYTSPEFKKIVFDLIETKDSNIIINGNELDYIDSTGLGILMSIYKKAQEKRLEVSIINLKPNIYKLFDITGLNKVFNIQG